MYILYNIYYDYTSLGRCCVSADTTIVWRHTLLVKVALQGRVAPRQRGRDPASVRKKVS